MDENDLWAGRSDPEWSGNNPNRSPESRKFAVRTVDVRRCPGAGRRDLKTAFERQWLRRICQTFSEHQKICSAFQKKRWRSIGWKAGTGKAFAWSDQKRHCLFAGAVFLPESAGDVRRAEGGKSVRTDAFDAGIRVWIAVYGEKTGAKSFGFLRSGTSGTADPGEKREWKCGARWSGTGFFKAVRRDHDRWISGQQHGPGADPDQHFQMQHGAEQSVYGRWCQAEYLPVPSCLPGAVHGKIRYLYDGRLRKSEDRAAQKFPKPKGSALWCQFYFSQDYAPESRECRIWW